MGKKLVHSDNSRLGQWLYSRLWHLCEEGKTLTTKELIQELSGFFKLNLGAYQMENLKKKIARTRNTVDKRFKRHLLIRSRLAEKWRTDLRLIKRWDIGKIIDIQDHHSLKRIGTMLLERDYVNMVSPEEIPSDMKMFIWD